MGCALSIHQKDSRKRLGCALYIGARYLPENTVCSCVKLVNIVEMLGWNTFQYSCVQQISIIPFNTYTTGMAPLKVVNFVGIPYEVLVDKRMIPK
jgi:hypothetical protein